MVKVNVLQGLFFETFGVEIKYFSHPFYGFYLIGFDRWLHSKYGGYEDGKTSMKDIIKKKYGKIGVALIEELIG